MVIRNIQHFSEIDGKIREDDYYEDFEEMVVNPDLGNDRIVISGPLYRLRGTSLIIAEGTYYNYDEDTCELEPDFSLSLLYESSGEPDLNSYLYWESDGPACMFHNYIMSLGQENNAEISELFSDSNVA